MGKEAFEDTKGVIKSRKIEEEQTTQWPKSTGQTTQWPKPTGQNDKLNNFISMHNFTPKA